MQDVYDAIIIGAGPAGMMAAITSAKKGRKVLLLEKMLQPGKKLLISGKGRCNLTNAGSIDKFLEKFSPSGVFLRNAFAEFFKDELCAFFESAGCPLKTERGERIFPASDRSGDVLNALKKQLKQYDVQVRFDEEVKDVIIGNSQMRTVTTKSGESFCAPKVAICTGGLSYPETGSSGFGIELARKLGHTIIAPRPGLVPVVTRTRAVQEIQGVSLENVNCSVISNGKVIESRFGDMLFTHFGLSGPIILDLSAVIYDLIESGKKAAVSINLKPALDAKKLDARLQREILAHPNSELKTIIETLLPRSLTVEFLKYCRLNEAKRANQITKDERKKLMDCLFDFRFEITGTKSIKDAIITRGGVSTKEINPKTMESRIVKGIYFAGEAIDVDAKTGGYNMQAAFSTGYVCGENL